MDGFLSVVRRIVRELVLENEKVPTFALINDALIAGDFSVPYIQETIEWNWSMVTLMRWMREGGFHYTKQCLTCVYTKERTDICRMRDNYPEWIKIYRNNGYEVFYQDETWIFKNNAPINVWQRLCCSKGNNIDYKALGGSGQGFIVAYVGSAQTELLDDCLHLFIEKRAQILATPEK